MKALTHLKTYASLSLAVMVLTGCATGPDRHPEDPFEPLNREIYSFNSGVDMFVFKPAAGLYHKFIPPQARHGVTNFFSNVNDVNVAANEILQFKIQDAIVTGLRFTVNSTLGVAGLFDVASSMGIYKKRQDFGTTLAFYGWKSAPYLVIPLLGPSTVRDTAALFVDWYMSPYAYVREDVVLWALGINFLNQRSNLLEEISFVQYAAMDDYSFVRDIYLQRRNALINGEQNGNEWNSNDAKWDDWNVDWSKPVAPGVETQVPGSAPASGTAPITPNNP